MPTPTRTTNAAMNFVADLATQGFWGFVTRKFEAGDIVHIRREENIKPSALLPETHRSKVNGNEPGR